MSPKSFPRVFSRDSFPPLSRHRLRLPPFREQSVNTSVETGRSNGESLRSRGTFLGWTGCYFSVQSPRRFSVSLSLSISLPIPLFLFSFLYGAPKFRLPLYGAVFLSFLSSTRKVFQRPSRRISTGGGTT